MEIGTNGRQLNRSRIWLVGLFCETVSFDEEVIGNEAFKKAYKRLLSSTLRLSRLIPRTTFCHTIGHSRVELAENPAARLSSDVEWQGDSSTNGTMPSSFGALNSEGKKRKKNHQAFCVLVTTTHPSHRPPMWLSSRLEFRANLLKLTLIQPLLIQSRPLEVSQILR
ncbi:hypothetical protein PSHT_00106 [Puccinia striiformis]|uniref:Uncharacterized protein n=1 Tax=Puccinia striiformis TaxID=27350 RepID=A0A2S4WNZ0_9BASI|nr:hypothetical protein PSHT_00106 [Puccinia striiformis]